MTIPTFAISASQEAPLALRQAILVYRGGSSTFATAHEVRIDAGRPTILAGRLLTSEGVVSVARALSEQAVRGGFVPPNLIYLDGETLAWWMPPGRRHVSFRCAELGAPERGAVVPHPGLVFAVDGRRSWRVWAVAGAERPSETTTLCQAPYFNVNDGGVICVGNVRLPDGSPAERIEAWDAAFFGSFFTHPNAQPLVKYRGGAMPFWRDMLDGKFEAFPRRVLLPLKYTLGDVLRGRGA